MALRGRGRGGGGGRGGVSEFDRGYPPDKMKPHEDFPDTTLPGNTCATEAESKEEKALRESAEKFDEFWRRSCYHLHEDAPKKRNEDKEIETFSDRKHKIQSKPEALASYLKLTMTNFPAELIQGSKRGQLNNKKLRWDRDSDKQAFDVFENLEQTHNHKDGDKKAEKKGDEEEDEQEEEEVERDENSDDDYNQNIEFDDDDDDWNQEGETYEDYYN
ncbi:hypothetical protein ACP70R_004723 [Stipagrostis hirtigluma subsp. patula]